MTQKITSKLRKLSANRYLKTFKLPILNQFWKLSTNILKALFPQNKIVVGIDRDISNYSNKMKIFTQHLSLLMINILIILKNNFLVLKLVNNLQ